MNTEALKTIGLTDNEIKIYLAILRLGKAGGTQIRKSTEITNSRVYAAIDSLITKGLVTYEKHPTGKVYCALDPSVLKEYSAQRMKQLEETIPFLRSIQNLDKKITDTAVFEGYHGFKSAMLQMTEECPVGETIDIIGFSNQAYKNTKLAALLRDINKISVRKKHKFRMILDNKDNSFYRQRKEEKISEIRFMGKNFVSPAAIDIFQDKTYILMWDEEPYAFYIKNAAIARGFKVYFEFLWKIAKK